MRRRDKEVIFDGEHYQVVHFENFLAKPFGVVDKLSGHRVFSFESEHVAVSDAKDREERIKQYAN